MAVTRHIPEPREDPTSARDRRELEFNKRLLFDEKATAGGRGCALISMGTLASSTADAAIASECVDAIGAVLTQDAAWTTLRQNAAYALGLTKSPQALDHLERVLKASDEDKTTKYVNTVRASVVQAVGAIWQERKTEKAVDGRVRELLAYVVEHDRYDAKRIARQMLAKP
jgi:hypothetical protein